MARGAKPVGTTWAVPWEKPDYDARSPLGVVALQNAAITTLGDYRHRVELGDTRLSDRMHRVRGGR